MNAHGFLHDYRIVIKNVPYVCTFRLPTITITMIDVQCHSSSLLQHLYVPQGTGFLSEWDILDCSSQEWF